MAEAFLGFEDLAAGDEERGDAVTQSVPGGLREPGGGADGLETVPEDFGSEAAVVAGVGAEHPGPQRGTNRQQRGGVFGEAVRPRVAQVVPQLGGVGARA